MNKKFILSCESSIDLNKELISKSDLSVLSYRYFLGEDEFYETTDDQCQERKDFYKYLRDGGRAYTTQLTPNEYEEYFRSLPEDKDILHITLGTGMTKSYRNAMIIADMMNDENTHRKILVMDSLCTSTGYGMLMMRACALRDQGADMETVYNKIMEDRLHIHHIFYGHDIEYFKKCGRISGPAAFIVSVLNICPIFKIDNEGKIYAYNKKRGSAAAMAELIAQAKANISDDESLPIYTNFSDNPEESAQFVELVKQEFPGRSVSPFPIGPEICANCGRNTISIFYYSKDNNR